MYCFDMTEGTKCECAGNKELETILLIAFHKIWRKRMTPPSRRQRCRCFIFIEDDRNGWNNTEVQNNHKWEWEIQYFLMSKIFRFFESFFGLFSVHIFLYLIHILEKYKSHYLKNVFFIILNSVWQSIAHCLQEFIMF